MENEYSPYKAVHHIDSIRAGVPVSTHWFITHRCNYCCLRCANVQDVRLQHFNRYDEWALDDALRVAVEMKEYGVKAQVLSGGEPMFHKDFDKLVGGLLDIGFQLGMISNGSLLPSVDIDQLAKFEWIRFSVAGMAAETYNSLHRTSLDIWSIMEEYVPLIKRSGCTVGVSYLVQPENYLEIPEFAAWAKSVGFDTCRFTSCWVPTGELYTESQKESIVSLIDDTFALSSPDFKIFSFAERMNVASNKRYSHCYYSDLNPTISANGNLYYCCMLQNSDAGYIGNLKSNSFASVWESRKQVDVTKCPVCWFDKKNEFIEYLTDDSPRHINFI